VLRNQLEGEQVGDLDDEATKAKKFDEKEKRLIALQRELEIMKEKLARASRVKAELVQGISILSQKLGIPASKTEGKNLPETLVLCDSKIKELLTEKKQMISSNRSKPQGGRSVGERDQRYVRVNLD